MMNKLSKFSILTIVPLFFILFLIAFFFKSYFIDLPFALENEKQKHYQQLRLLASMLQSNFTYYLSKNDPLQIDKELTLMELDQSHYKQIVILDQNLKVRYAQDEKLLKTLSKEIQEEIKDHNIEKIQKNKALYIEYDSHHDVQGHFDVVIPLDAYYKGKAIRTKSFILFFHYSIFEELEAIKSFFTKKLIIDLIFSFCLFIVFFLLTHLLLIKNIRRLSVFAKNFTPKGENKHPNISGFYEVKLLSEAFKTMAETIERDFIIIEIQNRELIKFKRTVEQSPTMVMMTDPKDKIEYVNPALLRAYGYTATEVIGKTPRIFSSGLHDQSFYQQMWHDILNKGIWSGKIVNKTKEGKTLIEDIQIFPILDDDGVTTNYIGTKQDITIFEEQQKILTFQNKLAQMGEMISMIAHQWRQPLSSISAIAATNTIKIQLDKMDPESLLESFQNIENTTTHLSSTIDDFRNFFKSNKEKVPTSFKIIANRSMQLIQHTFDNLNIACDMDIEDRAFESLEGELMQVVLNLLKNSADIFEEKSFKSPQIRLFTQTNDQSISLVFQDNAGGSDVEPIEQIFEPYFTTKAELQGTGLGLYMSKIIVEEHCQGTMNVHNIQDGIEFIITLPLV